MSEVKGADNNSQMTVGEAINKVATDFVTRLQFNKVKEALQKATEAYKEENNKA